jgi:hypothetical protein
MTTRFCFLPMTLLVLFLSSCAIHTGTFESGIAISNNEFRVAGMAEGHASTFYFLGLGGLSKSALVMEAKRDLYAKYPLAKGMVLSNVTVDFKRSFFFVVYTNQVTITADIIDFNPENRLFPYQGFYTDDSTFFPTSPMPIPNAAFPIRYDREHNAIKQGTKVSFYLNNKEVSGVVEEINNYGIKCVYQSEAGTRKIYLKPINITIQEYNAF